MTRLFASILLLSVACLPTQAAAPKLNAPKLNAETINAAGPTSPAAGAKDREKDREKRPDPSLIKAQVLLDRARFSPGEIDGKPGENLTKAIRAYAQAQGLISDGSLTAELWSKLAASSADLVVVEYTITEADVKGPFVKKIPRKMEDMKSLPSLGYRTAVEALAERFHMSEDLLRALNPNKPFSAGASITVANVRAANVSAANASGPKDAPKAARIEVDKSTQTVKAFGKSNELLAFYPATVGSDEKPSPSGALKVISIHSNPVYRYNPEYAFKGVKTKRPFTIRSGPNNPVGNTWIGLSEKGYGIHGSPEPSKISKAESHGCIRLTNWDAQQLGVMASKGTPVVFVDGAAAAAPVAQTPAPQPASETTGSGAKRSR